MLAGLCWICTGVTELHPEKSWTVRRGVWGSSGGSGPDPDSRQHADPKPGGVLY